MLKLLLLLTIFHSTLTQFWFGPPPPGPPPPNMMLPPPQGMMPPPQGMMSPPQGVMPPPPYPGMAVVPGPSQVEVSHTVYEQTIPKASTLCICTEASNCRITPKYKCQGNSVVLEGPGGDGVCCLEADIIC